MSIITRLRLSLIVATLILLVTLNSCEPPHQLSTGDYCRARGIDPGHVAIACKTPQDYVESMKATSARDLDTLERLSTGGLMFALANDITVKVLTIDDTMAQVVVLQGRNSGEELWLAIDHLAPDPSRSDHKFADVWDTEAFGRLFDQMKDALAREDFDHAAESASNLVLLVPEANRDFRSRIMALRDAVCRVAGTSRLRNPSDVPGLDTASRDFLAQTPQEEREQEFEKALLDLRPQLNSFSFTFDPASLKAGDLITLFKPVTIQYVPYFNRTHSPLTITLRAGTHVQFVSRDGDNVRFHVEYADYGIYGDYDASADAVDVDSR
jgi:hypothetical protein